MKVERQLQGTLNTVITELIKERGLDDKIQAYSVQEEHRADITLKKPNGQSIFFIELKDPTARDGRSVFDSGVVLRELGRAQELNLKFFGNCNFLACAFFDTEKISEKVSVNEGFFSTSDITRLSRSYSPTKEIISKLKSIADFYISRAIEIIERKPIKFSELDELFIFKIRKLIEAFANPICDKVWERYKSDKVFSQKIVKYAQSQLWNKPSSFEEIENLTHIGILMLISKLIFYKTYVDNQTWHKLSPMRVPDDVDTPEKLQNLIWEYFNEFKEVTGNFELLIGERSDIIFQIPFVSDVVLDLVNDVLDTEGHYNFNNIPFDIIGRIFEELIREDERHKLGQYFTPPHVIDLINAFTITKSNDVVFDPSCGSGTFLVRAYERKKSLSIVEKHRVSHKSLLNEIYGNDLSGYPAYLSMLNLAIRDTSKPSYPRIINKDFFSISENSKVSLHNQEGVLETKPLPRFNAIVGNPPYTRQEDIGTMRGTVKKSQIQNLIKKECGLKPSQRTSIYAYFFYHAQVFLKENGYLAFICQNSWLDAEYGIDLQKYFLSQFEIVAVIDSEVERFFPSASVNTTIVIARKQSNESSRQSNIVKFIYLTSPLAQVLNDYKGVDNFCSFLTCTNVNQLTNSFQINCIQQALLSRFSKWGQFLKAPKVYFEIISKGGEKFKNLAGDGGIANIFYGLKTGCNEYFFGKDVTGYKDGILLSTCLNNFQKLESIKEVQKEGLRIFKNGLNECWLIEEEFIQAAIKLTRVISDYIIDKVNHEEVVLYIHQLSNYKTDKSYNIKNYKRDLKENYPYVYSYIQYGERKMIKDTIVSQKPSCKGRPAWWDLGEQKRVDFILLQFRDKRSWVPIADVEFILGNVAFFGQYKNPIKKKLYDVALNSTFAILQSELLGRVNLGEGLLTTYGPDLEVLQVLDIEPSKVLQSEIDEVHDSLHGIKAISILDELGLDIESSTGLVKVARHRLAIDNLFLKLLGYKDKAEREELLLQIYSSTIQLINGRINKALSLKGVKAQRNKVAFKVYIEQLKELLIESKHEARNTFKFAKELERVVSELTSESKLQKKILDSYWKEKFGKLFNEQEIADSEQMKLFS